jgi:IS1 family transposase/transposase-like protein
MKKAQDWAQPCPNPNCPYHNQFHCGNIIAQTTYMTKSGKRRVFKCTHCGQLFSETRDTVFYDLRVPEEKVILVLKLCLVAVSLSGISFAVGVKEETILRWLQRAAEQSERVNARLLQEVQVSQVQLDELWNFVARKQAEHSQADGEACQESPDGRHWVWLSYAPESCLLLATEVGPRTLNHAQSLIQKTAAVVQGVPCFFSDGFSCYFTALLDCYQQVIHFPRTGKRGRPRKERIEPHPQLVYAQLVKEKRNGRLQSLRVQVRCGAERLKQLGLKVSTSLVERLNLTLRTALAPLVRKSPSFCKQPQRLEHRVVFFQSFYNLARPHMSLRRPLQDGSVEVPPFQTQYEQRTPALAAGLTDHIWSFRELLTAKLPANDSQRINR